MEFSAISTYTSMKITAKPSRKPNLYTLNPYISIHFRRKSDHDVSFAPTLKASRSSVSAQFTEPRFQGPFSEEYKKEKDWIHFVGIGGSGLSALAMLALKQGYEVSGSDIARSRFMDRLQEAGARIYLGHSVSNIQRSGGFDRPDVIVVSSAIPWDNVEILHAKAVGVPVYKRGLWLEKVTRPYNLIAVSGTHGKTTTASMLAYVLSAMGDDLTAVIGANVPQFPGGNILSGFGHNFVLEADEYDGCFLRLSPYIAVVTNVEWEHVDIFQDEEAVKNSFRRFLKQIRSGGHLILCGNSEGAYTLLGLRKPATMSKHVALEWKSRVSDAGYKINTYGTSNFNEWHASSIRPNSHGGTDYVLHHMGIALVDISLQLPGVHNVLNSLAVIATVSALINDQNLFHESINSIASHLNNFNGVSRRFEMIGKIYECHIFDDYAHHPTEVRAVLQAARQTFPLKALWVVFQPHTFSRLAAFLKDFASAFGDADRVIITEICAAREANVWNISGRHLANSITSPPSEYIPFLEDVVDKLAHEISNIPEREIAVITLGAGDITTVGPRLLRELQRMSGTPS